MRAPVTKLAAVLAMTVGLALGGAAAAGATPMFVPCWERWDGADGACAASARVIQLDTDGDGTPRAGYMVGRFFVGFLP